eukprot:14189295-Ditylum_brightwellii.AAC.1
MVNMRLLWGARHPYIPVGSYIANPIGINSHVMDRIDVNEIVVILYHADPIVAFVGCWAFACSLMNGIGTVVDVGVE